MSLQGALTVTASALAGPFDQIDGIPLHPLVVHAAIVLVPLACLGVIAMAIWPRFSRQYGWIVAAAAVAAAGASWMARLTGEKLAEQIGSPAFNHDQLGKLMPFFATALAIVVVALWLIDRRAPEPGSAPRGGLRTAVAVLAVIVALASLVWVIRVGHSGSKSVWSGRVPVDISARP